MTPRRIVAAAAAAAVFAAAFALAWSARGSGPSLAGISVLRSTVRTPAGPAPLVRVGVRLGDRRYRVVPVLARGSVPSALDALVVMNADFYDLATHAPSGRVVIGGRDARPGPWQEPWLELSPGPVRIGKGLAVPIDLVSGKPRYVVDGRPVARLMHDGVTPFQYRTRAPRVAVAIAGDRLWLVGVGPPGMTMPEFQRLVVSLHPRAALGFDGGPSADIAVLGRPLLGQPETAVPVDIAIIPAED